ncbi:hypothetical protein D3C84_527430 [compost metagenome]
MQAPCDQQYHQRAYRSVRRLGWPHNYRFKSASAEVENQQRSSLVQDPFFRSLEVMI